MTIWQVLGSWMISKRPPTHTAAPYDSHCHQLCACLTLHTILWQAKLTKVSRVCVLVPRLCELLRGPGPAGATRSLQ